ncbi:accessory Sec system protein Asp1 [Gemella sp. GH3]|uniref:accessory Sec system protein Asp1 n=1 Tax=unclassified Gemella TaxID=2624949 RepID=UPI0015CFBBB5|nr:MULTISPECIES: accessory Sec system protein Asp1 [unclassified Gemella]MBF0714051.1 accessory Sec system protein Asp1 [Gemella sp. GH3.1]NYS51003.1 accessory Sec system protein Asp1 [Gemella sp. GH3]
MFYFIASWYSNDKKWEDNVNVWYRNNENMEFDDIVNQLRMFNKEQENTELIVLNYSPNLRSFLHRQDLLEIAYYSIFDDIQQIKTNSISNINYKDFNWGDNVEYIYTPFLVVVNKNNKLYANIDLSNEGNIIYITFFDNDKITKKYVFDDRGFISSILYFENEVEKYKDYLNEEGIWQIRENIIDNGKVLINPLFKDNFNKKEYNNIEELIFEKLEHYLAKSSSEDTILIAADERHNDLVCRANNNANLVFSFFEDRFTFANYFPDYFKTANLFIADNEFTQKNLINNLSKYNVYKDVYHVTPYDTRLRLGTSQRKKELIIYLLVDTISQQELKDIINIIFKEMLDNKNINLALGTYEKNGYTENSIVELVNEIISINEYFQEHIIFQQEDDKVAENQLEEKIKDNVKLAVINTEIDLIKELEYVRLIVDLGDKPDLFTQIAGISAGIPQVNKVVTSYVDHKKNGYVLSRKEQLVSAINYYFEGLSNWNKSLVYSVDKLIEYTSDNIIRNIKNYIRMSNNE